MIINIEYQTCRKKNLQAQEEKQEKKPHQTNWLISQRIVYAWWVGRNS